MDVFLSQVMALTFRKLPQMNQPIHRQLDTYITLQYYLRIIKIIL